MYYYQKNGRFVYLCINAGHEFGTSVRMLWINELEENLLVLIVQSANARHAAFWREPCGAVRKAAGLSCGWGVGHVGECTLSTLKRAHNWTLRVYIAGFLQTGAD